jgi:RhoGAP domain
VVVVVLTCATDFVDPQERIKELSRLIAVLPIANYSLLRALTAHLILIVQNSSVNKMTMRNVGIVFSPTLGIPAGVFSLMLGEFNRVFNVDADTDEIDSQVGDDDKPSELHPRNSRQYSDAAADQLLGLAGRTLKSVCYLECLDVPLMHCFQLLQRKLSQMEMTSPCKKRVEPRLLKRTLPWSPQSPSLPPSGASLQSE